MTTTRLVKVMVRQAITRVTMVTIIISTSRMALRMTSTVAIVIDTAARTTMIRQKETARRRTEKIKIIIRKAARMMKRTRKMAETMRIISIQVPMLIVVRGMRLLMNIRMGLTFMTTITTMTKLVMKRTDRRTNQRMITAMTMGQCRP